MELHSFIPNVMAGLAIVAALAIGAWFLIGLHAFHGRKEEKELPQVELPGHIHEVFSGAPLAVTVFIVFIGISLIVYVLYAWLAGVTY